MINGNKSIGEIFREIKSLGEVLISHNYPRVSIEDDSVINCLKVRELIIDGYQVILHYNKCDYGDYYLETLQTFSKNCPFLPFHLVCKVAKNFLGNQHLSLIEIFTEGKRVYCWTLITDKEGSPQPNPQIQNGEDCVYEGFNYVYMNPKNVSFY